jgi:hypothetical protein
MTTILFIISLIGLFALIGSKIFELKVRKIHFTSKMFVKGDLKIHQTMDFIISKYHLYKKIASLFLFDFLPSYLYEILVKLKDYVAKKYYSTSDGFRGRRILRSNGSVSSFLERLAEKRTDSLNHKV